MYNITNCKALLEELKCKQCSKFLSVLPVYYCSATGNVCGRCVSNVDWMISNGTLERAVAYEAVAKFLIFPCVNHSNGCQQKLRIDEVEQHEKQCAAVTIECPFNVQFGLTSLKCEWKGTAVSVTAHLHAVHKEFLQVGLPTFVMNTYDTHVKNFFVSFDGQTFVVVTEYLKDTNKFYFTMMGCETEPNNQCYRFQLEIGRSNDFFLVFRKPNVEKFGNVQDLIDKPENMITVDVTSVLTMLDDPSGVIYCKMSIFKKSKKEIAEITGKPDTPVPAQPKQKSNKPPKKSHKFPTQSGQAVNTKGKPNLGETSNRSPIPDPPTSCKPATFLDEFECPICNEYMVAPIFICPAGHSLCGRCKPKLSTCPTCRIPMLDVRNFALEKLAATVKYPCRYAESGCTVTLAAEHIQSHQLHCHFAYGKCPLKFITTCPDEDIINVIGHMQEKHPHMWVEPNRQYAREINSMVTSSYWATAVSNEIFVICCKHSSSNGPIKFAALHLGMSKAKQKYRFRLEFCDQTSMGLKCIISQLCKPFIQNPSMALKQCLAIPLDILQPFIVQKPNPRLFFKIFMEKM